MKTNRLLNWLSYITIFLVWILLIMIGCWHFYPYKIIDIDSPLEVLNDPIRGDIVKYRVKFCKYSEIGAEISRQLVNDEVVTYAHTPSTYGSGCRDFVSSLEIPEYLPNGEYKIALIAKYQVNPIRKIEIKYETESFRVER